MSLTPNPSQDATGDEYTAIHKSHPNPRYSTCYDSPKSPGLPSTQSPHRELPSPTSLTRVCSDMPSSLPPPPPQIHGPETLRQWLLAKAEEDRRAQEEEKTRQETLKLEQRRIEHSMLMESIRVGVSPNLIPTILAGISSSGNSALSISNSLQSISQNCSQTPTSVQAQSPLAGPRPPATLPSLVQPVNPNGAPRIPVSLHSHNGYNRPIGEIDAPVYPSIKNRGSHTLPISQPAYSLPPPMEPQTPQTSAPGSTPLGNTLQPSQSSNPIAFHHWVPPDKSQTQNTPHKNQQYHVLSSNASPHSNEEFQSLTFDHKRKSPSTHHALPPPSRRLSDISARKPYRPRPRGKSFQPTESHYRILSKGDVSIPQEQNASDADCSEQSRCPKSRSAAPAHPITENRKFSEKAVKQEEDPSVVHGQVSYREPHSHISDTENGNKSDPPQETALPDTAKPSEETGDSQNA